MLTGINGFDFHGIWGFIILLHGEIWGDGGKSSFSLGKHGYSMGYRWFMLITSNQNTGRLWCHEHWLGEILDDLDVLGCSAKWVGWEFPIHKTCCLQPQRSPRLEWVIDINLFSKGTKLRHPSEQYFEWVIKIKLSSKGINIRHPLWTICWIGY